MRVELIYAPGCDQCATASASLRAAAEEVVPALEWRELSVLDQFDYAVELGVLTLPAIAIDGKLVFSSLPTPRQLRKAVIAQAKRGA